MTKNNKGGKGAKKGKNSGPTSGKVRDLLIPEEGSHLGIVDRALGDKRFMVLCFDAKGRELRLCHARGAIRRYQRIVKGSVVLVSSRDFESRGEERGDIFHLYNDEEARRLHSMGLLPEIQEGESAEGGIVFDSSAPAPDSEEETVAPQENIDLDDL